MNSEVILYCKQRCGPCIRTQKYLTKLLTEHPSYESVIRVFYSVTQPNDVKRLGINQYPTAVILDGYGEEVERMLDSTRLINGGLEELIKKTQELNVSI